MPLRLLPDPRHLGPQLQVGMCAISGREELAKCAKVAPNEELSDGPMESHGISWNLMECHVHHVPICSNQDNQADSMDFNRLQIFQLPGLGKFIR